MAWEATIIYFKNKLNAVLANMERNQLSLHYGVTEHGARRRNQRKHIMAGNIAEKPKKNWTKPELKQIRAGSAENGNRTSPDKNSFS